MKEQKGKYNYMKLLLKYSNDVIHYNSTLPTSGCQRKMTCVNLDINTEYNHPLPNFFFVQSSAVIYLLQ